MINRVNPNLVKIREDCFYNGNQQTDSKMNTEMQRI